MNDSPRFYSGQIAKWIRVILSLTIIVLSIVKRMWPISILGIAFLLSAFTGTCPISLRLGRKKSDSEERNQK